MKKQLLVTGLSSIVLTASSAFQVDKSVMSDKYWAIWNDDEQAKIEGEGEQRKISFRGFRGRYRLSWTDANGKALFKFVDVK